MPQTKHKFVDWAHLVKRYPDYKEHIARIRKNQDKLLVLKTRLEEKFK